MPLIDVGKVTGANSSSMSESCIKSIKPCTKNRVLTDLNQEIQQCLYARQFDQTNPQNCSQLNHTTPE